MSQARRAITAVARFQPDRRVALALVGAMAALGVAHVLVRTSTYGPAITLDSIHYLSAAGNLAAGAGLKIFDDGPFLFYPPFFPMLLAFLDILGIEPPESVRWVNAAVFGCIILTSGIWLLRALASRALALVATAAILASLPLNSLSAQAMTEPLFVLLVILALIQLSAFLTRDAGWKPVILAAVLTALAALTRYPGVTLIFAGVALLLLYRAVPFAARLRYAAVFGGIASLPVAAALLRRWLLDATLEAPEGVSGQSLSDSIRQALLVTRDWLAPENAPDWSVNLWLAAGALLAAGVAVVLVTRIIRRGSSRQGIRAALPFGLFSLVYLIFIVIAAPRLVGQLIDSRYLLPIYVPVILAGARLLDDLLASEAWQRIALPKWAPASAILIIGIISIGFSVQKNLTITADAREFGYFDTTYNTVYWDDFETLDYLENIHGSTLIFSQDIAAIWWRYPASWEGYRWIGNDMELIEDLIENHPDEVYLVSLDAAHSYQNPFLAFLNDIDIPFHANDGMIMRIPAEWRLDESILFENTAAYLTALIEDFSPAEQSVFDIYVAENIIIYTKDPCEPQDTNTWFFLHITPEDTLSLPLHRRSHGFESLDFIGDRSGIRFNMRCMMSVSLPKYAIAEIVTGQYTPLQDQHWSVEFSFLDGPVPVNRAFLSPVEWVLNDERYHADMMRHQTNEIGKWVASSTFNVYANERMLVYIKEPCRPEDTDAWFFLHIDPEDPGDLSRERQQHGFYSFDFLFDWQGTWSDERCFTTVDLPDYGITNIRTGQYDLQTGEHLWIVEFAFPDSPNAGSTP